MTEPRAATHIGGMCGQLIIAALKAGSTMEQDDY